MIATPAIFYDIIAPLAITVVLFLIGFKNKEQPVFPKPEVKKTPAPRIEKPKQEQKPDIKELGEYIDSVLQKDFSLLPDNAVLGLEDRQCKRFREFLMSFIYKSNPVITEKDGRYISIFDKTNLKRFVELQYNVQRKGE
jgi:hypothetical protein